MSFQLNQECDIDEGMQRKASRYKIKEEYSKEINKSLLHKYKKEKDGASMSSSLGPVLGNVIMTKIEKKICETIHLIRITKV